MLKSVRGTPTHLRDPKRRWLRHTYQEGPGFRFLATRDGRPPDLRVRPAPLSVVRRRTRYSVAARRRAGLTIFPAAGP
jgi:hypothetical protein